MFDLLTDTGPDKEIRELLIRANLPPDFPANPFRFIAPRVTRTTAVNRRIHARLDELASLFDDRQHELNK